MHDEVLEQIRRVIGWRPGREVEGTVQDLNKFPVHLIEVARRLSGVLRYAFLSHYTNAEALRFLPKFMDDVVERGEPIETWLRGRILVPSFTTIFLVQMSVEEIIRPLNPTQNEQWHRLRPQHLYWEAGEVMTGAPALLRPEIDYRYSPPSHVLSLGVKGAELDPIADVFIAVRRWIASNLAYAARKRNLLTLRDPRELIHGCFRDIGEISDDAVIAAQALIRELETFPDYGEKVPGFIGPDQWFRKEPHEKG
jgi:hypothetical protein